MIYIVHDDFTFTRFLLSAFADRKDIELVPMKLQGYWARRIFSINRKLGFTVFSPILLNKHAFSIFKKVKPSDTLIFFDYLTYTNVKSILKRTECGNIHFWFWNTVDKYTSPVFRFRNSYTHFHTFDDADASKYDMILHRQIYRMPELKDESSLQHDKVDFFFIGKNKGRQDLLMKMKDMVRAWGYTTRFIILDKHLKIDSCDGIEVISKEVDYREVLDMSERARVLVDITKKNQVGLTLRCVEGIYLNKKILSNNKSLIFSDIYSKENVLVFDDTLKKEDVDEFMSCDFRPYDFEALYKYSVESWLKNILAVNTQGPEK